MERVAELLISTGELKEKVLELMEENKKLKMSEKVHAQKFDELLERATKTATEVTKLKKELENAYSIIKDLEDKPPVQKKSVIQIILDLFRWKK